jgi:mannose-6-phosphate isomerase
VNGSRLTAYAVAARRWLFEDGFALWSSAGFDAASGQFVEQLSPTGEPAPEAARRSLVQARQLHVFAVAGRMGWTGPWRAVMSAAAATLLARGRTDDGDWVFSFDPAGRPLDARPDLYTQAFMIFGLAHAAMALDRPDLLAAARETRERLERAWRAPAGGFDEGRVHPGLRRQNPHMHLLEAAMALDDAGGDAAASALAGELVDLFKARLVSEGGVTEYFDRQLAPLAGDRGRVREPGHAFEWAWLIGRWAESNGSDETALTDRLYAAGRVGVDPDGFVVDELWAGGAVRSGSARLWPQTERLRTALARGERTGGAADRADAAQACAALFAYLDSPRRGAWRDRRLAGGGWMDGPSPASSGYHIVGALEPLVRLWADRPGG